MPTAALATTGSVLTATEYNYLPRGVIASVTNSGSNQTGITSFADLTSMTNTSTYTNGRFYMVTAQISFSSSVAGDYLVLAINVGGTDQQSTYWYYGGTSEVQTATASFIASNLSGSTVVKLRAGRSTGTGNITVFHSRVSRMQIIDLGVA